MNMRLAATYGDAFAEDSANRKFIQTMVNHPHPTDIDLIMRRFTRSRSHDIWNDQLVTRQWLVTNGLGGYALGPLAGIATRRYHGLLIAALLSPLGTAVDVVTSIGTCPSCGRHVSQAQR